MRTRLTPTRIRCMKPDTREVIVWDSEVPHLGVRIRPNGSKRFVHRITIQGKLLKKSLGHVDAMTIDQARDAARQLDEELTEAWSTAGRNGGLTTPTFAVFVEETFRPSTAPLKKQSTIHTDEQWVKKHLLPAFGPIPVDEITSKDILDWYDHCSRRIPIGANRAMDVLSSILNHAVRLDVIEKNPSRRIKRNPSRASTRFLSAGERARLLCALDRVREYHTDRADAVRLLLFTGCRRGEINNLRWGEVGEDRLDLTDSKVGPRPVWFGEEARAVLDRRRTRVESVHPEGAPSDLYVFPHRQKPGEPMVGLEPFWRNFRRDIGLDDVRLHDLRHSFATEAVRRGVPLPVVSKLLGHSNISMTMRYAHVCDTEAEKTAERVGLHINNLLNPR